MGTKRTDIEAEELHPTYQTFAKVIGIDAAVKLGQEFGGSHMYFPRLDALTISSRAERDKKIIVDHESGNYNIEQLGRKYKMCAMGIQGVLKRAKACSDPSKITAPHGDALIEQIRQKLGELDEEGRREVLRYTLKKKNSSRS